MSNSYGQIGTSQAGRGMSAYGALGQLIEMLVKLKWEGVHAPENDFDGVACMDTNAFPEGLTVAMPGAEKALERIEADIKRISSREMKTVHRLILNACKSCGADKGHEVQYCLACQAIMATGGTVVGGKA